MSDDSVVVNGNVYPDYMTATVAEHPDIPPELKKVFITPPESPEKPADASNSSAGTQPAPTTDASPAPSYDTVLSPEEEQAYQQKFGPDASVDYDMRGYFKANPDVEPNAPGVHYPDTFKKPNHPTFSDESQYHGVNGNVGGHWDNANGVDIFTPGATNLKNMSMDQLKDYFQKVEPNVKLLPNIEDVPQHDWVSTVFQKAKQALQLPGDVYQGNVQPGSPQEIERANDLAGLMVFGPAPVAGKMAEGTLGSFMGVKSQSFDKAALQKAQELEASGAHHEEIWNQTGTFRGADGRWRQEIPDQDVNILDKGTILNPAAPDKGWTQIGSPETLSVKPSYSQPLPMDASIQDMMKFLTAKKNDVRLEHVLDHPELYQAYPWLKNIKVSPMPPGLDYAGMVKGNEIFMNTATPENFTSTIMHEVQHLIQNHEGFATGANSNMFFSPELRNARSQFEKAKEEAINNSSKELLGGTTKDVVEKYKDLIGAYEEGRLDHNSAAISKLQAIKEQHPEIYQRLSNVAKGEKLLREAETEAYEKYKNIMGEVESRNVQARLNMSNWQRTFQSPRSSEEKIVPREKQINSTDIEHHVIGRK